MLKALELSGFKSFADKTRFEFPAGITVIVGPNGSGKSNIVDAIKWVLGEQSAKSLRGKEMADVIFKGSGGANGRKPANSATATLILDNADRRFAFDADEVLVSRRVYRSGEAEYLINNETCRLKDIRNLFRGTGIGTDAYSLIEQGKVDRLLQASAKDRRAIFEEAAGISRFKAKKIEAQRRLARVEGNLVRLADIVEEVGGRYKRVKNQASKAAKYKELADRLQELRTSVGLKDWRALTEKLSQVDSNTKQFTDQSNGLREIVKSLESKSDEIEHRLDQFSTEVSSQQTRASQTRESITKQISRRDLNQSRLADLDSREIELKTNLDRLTSRHNEVATRRTHFDQDVQQSQQTCENAKEKLAEAERHVQEIDNSLERIYSENEQSKEETRHLIAAITDLGRMVSASETQIESFRQRQTQKQQAIDELESSLRQRQSAFDAFKNQKEQLQSDAEMKNSDLAHARDNLEATQRQKVAAQNKLAESQNLLTAKTQRQKVLEELEKRLEGINAGAKQLLEQARKSDSGPYREIIGVVADMVTVNVQHAGIVDVALGNAAQYLVVDGHELLDLLASEQLKVKGRVGFIQFNSPPTLGADADVNINGEQGVIGRADRLVQVSTDYAPFVRKLLGGTWIVRTLNDAILLHQRSIGKVRLVTLDGEIVEADGTVIVGPKAVVTGLVSRRSELRMLSHEISELQKLTRDQESQLEDIRQVESENESRVEALINENTTLSQKLADISVRSEETEKQISELKSKIANDRAEFSSTANLLETELSSLSGNRQNLNQNEARLEEINQIIIANDSKTAQLRTERQPAEQAFTTGKVELAKFEQQLDSLKVQQQKSDDEFNQLTNELERSRSQFAKDEENRSRAQREMTAAQSELQQLESELSQVTELLDSVSEKKNAIDQERRSVATELNAKREELRSIEDQFHKAEMTKSQLQMERTKLAERLEEDYGINIAEVESVPINEEQLAQREAIDNEISELRRKIGSIGSVNMDALVELDDLEQRYLKMDEQYQDLVSAKRTLENIIQRINTDSRRLFVETLNAIRGNFQTLFRQTFGGGKADIILEEDVDPLEAGVEIVATPPGKPEFNNSLLSGGEKALTAVSLLMAIFQFRPSSYCVLDEVDAPFDEANIGRFIDVLKSFLGWTKFVIVTHSKKTMTAATTLYGVTMQESGVSKRVSVRFEDVNESGEISQAALDRSADEERGVA